MSTRWAFALGVLVGAVAGAIGAILAVIAWEDRA